MYILSDKGDNNFVLQWCELSSNESGEHVESFIKLVVVFIKRLGVISDGANSCLCVGRPDEVRNSSDYLARLRQQPSVPLLSLRILFALDHFLFECFNHVLLHFHQPHLYFFFS